MSSIPFSSRERVCDMTSFVAMRRMSIRQIVFAGAAPVPASRSPGSAT
ncbi:hypothetical protein I551_7977 [Mycobacterium ulcerans str. Harvey]|uniref:Uncharacterized protein n=1 Tax=Mycobacterium ulcerans str. Harvey TaxID=1299332 RepID=A0ABN0QLJ7_MYCUL|nr:hypothetical protein I551_7977 [Mycobacterium ulcerans str. Harvey]